MGLNAGKRGDRGPRAAPRSDTRPTLAEAGIDKKLSSAGASGRGFILSVASLLARLGSHESLSPSDTYTLCSRGFLTNDFR